MPNRVPSRSHFAKPSQRADWQHQELYQTPQWKKLRAARLALPENAICYMCHRAPSTVGEHFIPHRGDVGLFLNPENIRGACKPCADWKTMIEAGLRNHWRTVLLQAGQTDLEKLLPW